MSQLIEKMSSNPSEIIKIDRGNLGVGKAADIVIFDPESKYTVKTADFVSKSKNSPYDGFELYGKINMTICNGKIVYQG